MLKNTRKIGIVEQHYVDDYVDCFKTEEKAIEVARDVIKIHQADDTNSVELCYVNISYWQSRCTK